MRKTEKQKTFHLYLAYFCTGAGVPADEDPDVGQLGEGEEEDEGDAGCRRRHRVGPPPSGQASAHLPPHICEVFHFGGLISGTVGGV